MIVLHGLAADGLGNGFYAFSLHPWAGKGPGTNGLGSRLGISQGQDEIRREFGPMAYAWAGGWRDQFIFTPIAESCAVPFPLCCRGHLPNYLWEKSVSSNSFRIGRQYSRKPSGGGGSLMEFFAHNPYLSLCYRKY